MRRNYLTILLAFALSLANAQNSPYYWFKGEKQFLQLHEGKTFILLDEMLDEKRLINSLDINRDQILNYDTFNLSATIERSKPQGFEKSVWAVIESNKSHERRWQQ